LYSLGTETEFELVLARNWSSLCVGPPGPYFIPDLWFGVVIKALVTVTKSTTLRPVSTEIYGCTNSVFIQALRPRYMFTLLSPPYNSTYRHSSGKPYT